MHRTRLLVVVAVVTGLLLAGGIVTGEAGTEMHNTNEGLECEFPLEIEDGSGETVVVEEEPEEVVVLAPNTAQHLWEIGAKEKVTGMPVNAFTAYLEGSEERTNIADEMGMPIQEEIVALEPDLVIADSIIPEESVESLRDSGLTVYHTPFIASLDDMYEEVERAGQLVGECDGASQTVTETRETIDEIAETVGAEEPETVYYDMGFPFTVGEGTLENELISLAGGENIALEADEPGYFEISEEVIAANDPDWIIVSEGSDVSDVTALQDSTAVEEDQIIEVNPSLISQHGPLNVVPLEQLAEAFHPEAMTEEEPTPTPAPDDGDDDAMENDVDDSADDGVETDDAADDAEPVVDDADDATDDAADDDGPGFAIGAAVVAILALAFAGRYRH